MSPVSVCRPLRSYLSLYRLCSFSRKKKVNPPTVPDIIPVVYTVHYNSDVMVPGLRVPPAHDLGPKPTAHTKMHPLIPHPPVRLPPCKINFKQRIYRPILAIRTIQK